MRRSLSCRLLLRSPMYGATRRSRSRSASTSRSAVSGAKLSTGGRRRSKSIPRTQPPTTTSPSPTSTRGSSTKRARRTKKRSTSSPITCRFVRTLSSSRKSMTARAREKTRKANRLAFVSVAAMLAAAAVACGPSYFEIPIETPIRPKMDVSPFQRVLVAGFVAGGSDALDTNQETVRLLRSQLRTKSSLKVIDADILSLIDIAQDQGQSATGGGEDAASLG